MQEAIDVAVAGDEVVLADGTYTVEGNTQEALQGLSFDGKAITVAGSNGGVILEAPGGYAVSFYTAERSTSVLKNLSCKLPGRGHDEGSNRASRAVDEAVEDR